MIKLYKRYQQINVQRAMFMNYTIIRKILSPLRKKHLNEFKRLNTTTDSIFELESNEVLIILKDGTNVTSWSDVKNRKDVMYVSEDLSQKTDADYYYHDLENAYIIIAKNLSDKVTSTKKTFSHCESLVVIMGLESWDVSNVTSMEGLFLGCKSLTSLNGVESWDVSNVTDMTALLMECSLLTNLDFLKNWNTSKVRKLWSSFADCTSLVDVTGLRNWDVSNVKDMAALFSDCENLFNLDGVELWNTSNVISLGSAFFCCKSLNDLSALRNWDVSNVRKMPRMFRGCECLRYLSGLDEWDVSNVEEFFYTFVNCSSLKNVQALGNWDVSSAQNMRSMFDGCKSLKTLSGLESWNLKSITTVERMFDGCESLNDVSAIESWNLQNQLNAGDIFRDCPNVKSNPLRKNISVKNKPFNLVDKDFEFMSIYGVGWCLIQLGEIYSRASYLTSVPYDCLKSIVEAIKEDIDFHVVFDGEGWHFEVRADNEQCYFNYLPGEKHTFDNMNKYDLAILIYNNISSNFHSWNRDSWGDEDLTPLLDELKEIIDNDFEV